MLKGTIIPEAIEANDFFRDYDCCFEPAFNYSVRNFQKTESGRRDRLGQ